MWISLLRKLTAEVWWTASRKHKFWIIKSFLWYYALPFLVETHFITISLPFTWLQGSNFPDLDPKIGDLNAVVHITITHPVSAEGAIMNIRVFWLFSCLRGQAGAIYNQESMWCLKAIKVFAKETVYHQCSNEYNWPNELYSNIPTQLEENKTILSLN